MNDRRNWRVELRPYTYLSPISNGPKWVATLYPPGTLVGGRDPFREVSAETKAECKRRAKEAIAEIEAMQADGPDTFYVSV